MNPLVSIGIPTYNRPEGLKILLDCIVNQTYRNIEIIISDNCSTNPKSRETIESYAARDPRIKAHIQKVNLGPLANFEYVLQNASGKYFMWAADDDYFELDTVENSLKGFTENKDVVVSGLNCKIIDHDTKEVTQPALFPSTLNLPFYKKYYSIVSSINEGVNLYYYALYEREFLLQCAYYTKPCFGADQFILLEMLRFGEVFINTNNFGLNYVHHEGQASTNLMRYRDMYTAESKWYNRRFFFSSFLINHFTLLFKNSRIPFVTKFQLMILIFRDFFTSRKFHLLKYDLGLNKVIAKIGKHRSSAQ